MNISSFKKVFLTFFSLLWISGGNNLNLIFAQEIFYREKENISIDYFDNLPANDYMVGPGDILKIIISRNYPELDTLATIDAEGTINVPKLNRIYVKNLTIDELSKNLDKSLKKFIKFPATEIQILKYRPIRVYVEGEVVSPGLKTLEGSLSFTSFEEREIKDNNNLEISSIQENNDFFPTVFDAIRRGEGITPFSDLKNIQIIRRNNFSNGGGKITATINFENVLNGKDISQNIRIYDGDVIFIKKSNNENNLNLTRSIKSNLSPSFLSVFVSGRVERPGSITVARSSVLNDAIDLAGGAKVLKGPVNFIRFKNDGTIDKRRFNYKKKSKRGSFENPFLNNGDVIIVDQSSITSVNQVLTELTQPITGIFSTYALIKLVSE